MTNSAWVTLDPPVVASLRSAVTVTALSPLFDLHPFTVCGRPDGERRFALWARSAEGALAMQATAEIV